MEKNEQIVVRINAILECSTETPSGLLRVALVNPTPMATRNMKIIQGSVPFNADGLVVRKSKQARSHQTTDSGSQEQITEQKTTSHAQQTTAEHTTGSQTTSPQTTYQSCGCNFTTHTHSCWGQECSNDNCGCYLQNNFGDGKCFKDIKFGCSDNYVYHFTNYIQVQQFLNSDQQFPGENGFRNQLVACGLNLGFDECDPDFHHCDIALKDLCIIDPTSPCHGHSVSEIYGACNDNLGNSHSPSSPLAHLSRSDLSNCLQTINENFENGQCGKDDKGKLGRCDGTPLNCVTTAQQTTQQTTQNVIHGCLELPFFIDDASTCVTVVKSVSTDGFGNVFNCTLSGTYPAQHF